MDRTCAPSWWPYQRAASLWARAMFSAKAPSGLYECGVGNPPRLVLDLPLRAIHPSGNWGTTETVAREWAGTTPLEPPDYIAWLKSLHVNWVGISVAIFVEDSMDGTAERVYDAGGTFSRRCVAPVHPRSPSPRAERVHDVGFRGPHLRGGGAILETLAAR